MQKNRMYKKGTRNEQRQLRASLRAPGQFYRWNVKVEDASRDALGSTGHARGTSELFIGLCTERTRRLLCLGEKNTTCSKMVWCFERFRSELRFQNGPWDCDVTELSSGFSICVCLTKIGFRVIILLLVCLISSGMWLSAVRVIEMLSNFGWFFVCVFENLMTVQHYDYAISNC